MRRAVRAGLGVSIFGVVVATTMFLSASAPDVAVERRVDAGPSPARSTPASPATRPAPQADESPIGATRAPLYRRASDRDLFATYRELDRSTRGGDLYVADSILVTCDQVSRTDSDVRPAGAGLGVRGVPPPAPVQIEAARDLLARCSGFAAMTRLSMQQARADLRGRLDRADDPVGWADSVLRHRRPPSDDLLRAILASQDPVAISDISPLLFERSRTPVDRPARTRRACRRRRSSGRC